MKKKTLPFAKTWVNMEGVMLSEVREAQSDKCQMSSLLDRLKNAKTIEARSAQRLPRDGEIGNAEMLPQESGFPP